MSLIVVGIHTGIGKSVCSAVICEALGFDYWKPVQAGDLEHSDSLFIKNHVKNPSCSVHPERYKLLTAASPHYAAERENLHMKKEDFSIPDTVNDLVIETAGGLMSPLSKGFLNIDLVTYLKLPVVLVSNYYLGSINHTLLTFTLLKSHDIPIEGIVFVGDIVSSTKKFVLEYTQLPLLFSIPILNPLDEGSIQQLAVSVLNNLKDVQ